MSKTKVEQIEALLSDEPVHTRMAYLATVLFRLGDKQTGDSQKRLFSAAKEIDTW